MGADAEERGRGPCKRDERLEASVAGRGVRQRPTVRVTRENVRERVRCEEQDALSVALCCGRVPGRLPVGSLLKEHLRRVTSNELQHYLLSKKCCQVRRRLAHRTPGCQRAWIRLEEPLHLRSLQVRLARSLE